MKQQYEDFIDEIIEKDKACGDYWEDRESYYKEFPYETWVKQYIPHRFEVNDKVQYVGTDLQTIFLKDHFYTIKDIQFFDKYNVLYLLTSLINDNKPKDIWVHEHVLIKIQKY